MSSPLPQVPWTDLASPGPLEALDPEILSQLAAWREDRARHLNPQDTDIWSRLRASLKDSARLNDA